MPFFGIYMGMLIRFLDQYVWVDGHRRHEIWLDEGDSAHCRICGQDFFEGALQVRENRLYCGGVPLVAGGQDNALQATRWGKVWQVRVAQHTVRAGVVLQQSFAYMGAEHVVTLMGIRGVTHVWWDSQNEQRLWMLPEGQGGSILFSSAMAAALVAMEIGDRRHLLCWSLLDGAVLFSGVADEYVFADDLTVVCTYADMRRHTCTRHYGYRNAEFCMYAQTCTCTNAHAYIPSLTPYLFAEALAVGEREEAMGYLNQPLRSDFDALLSYIGEVTEVRRPPVASGPWDVGLVDATGQGRVFRFDMQDDQIVDVRQIE